MAFCEWTTPTTFLVNCTPPSLPYAVDTVAVELRRQPSARPFAFATAPAASAGAVPLSGLRPQHTYWIACRAHRATAGTEVSGWTNASVPFSCSTIAGKSDAETSDLGLGMPPHDGVWRATWMYRVSEDGRADPDLLENHDAGDLVGEAAFLSDSVDFKPYRAAGEQGFFTAPAFPSDDTCMATLNASCTGSEGFLRGDACIACAAREIGNSSSAASRFCSMDVSRGRWWGDLVPRTFCGAVH
jgi:hypothetical protein